MISQQFSAELNCFRWMAALLVVITHIRNLLFVDLDNVVEKSIALKAFYFVTGFGSQAVIIFFVISGLLVGGISAKKYLDGKYDATEFVIHRFSRIYIVLIPAIAAGYLFDYMGFHFFNKSQLYTNSSIYGFVGTYYLNMNWETVLGNVMMLQTIAVPILGSNGPLWSLAYEWWYYAIFFGVIGLVSPANTRLARTLYGGFVLLLMALLPKAVIYWFLVWLVGVAISFLPLRQIKINRWIAYAIFIAVLIGSRMDQIFSEPGNLYRALARDLFLAAGCFLVFAASSQRQGVVDRAAKFHSGFAGFSYTTYLVHFPFLVFIVAVLNDVFEVPFYQQPSYGLFFYFFLLLTLIYLYSYYFSTLTEHHTPKLRRWLTGLALKTRIVV